MIFMDIDLDQRLAGPEYFDCDRLKARISARQCLLNQGKAKGMKIFGVRYMGKEVTCLDCSRGRRMAAYPPEAIIACSPPPNPGIIKTTISKTAPEIPRPKRLPAWLKNASAAVRRDYLNERKA